MTKAKSILRYLTTLIIGSITAVFLEDHFHRLVRQLYASLTYNQISFRMPKLDLYYTFLSFGISFGLFLLIFLVLLERQTKRQIQINLFLTLIFMICSLILYCYFDGNIKLIECTACDDGTIILEYSNLNYTKIFITTLITSLIPCIWTEIKNHRNTIRQTIFKAST